MQSTHISTKIIGVGPGGEEFWQNSQTSSTTESQNSFVSVRYRSSQRDFHEHIACGFANLYATRDLTDVTISCEGKHFKAHKIVLALSSPYFRHIFKVTNKYGIITK
jgi:hypothetical protein